MTATLGRIDWSVPWLAPYRTLGVSVARRIAAGDACCDALNASGLAPVRFVRQAELPPGRAYEQHIFDTGCVPTRENAHDFFNGLVWLHFPQTKQRLNVLQAAQIASDGVGAVRGAVRDALTLFDENAAVLQAPDAVWDALVARDWPHLFVTLRPLWSEVRLWLFGHALLEKLMQPRKPITAHVLRLRPTGAALPELDQWLALHLQAAPLAAKPFVPLPVLGVPGWWPANEAADFYADAQVFRPLRVAV